jgi:hypothetical protein
MCVTYRELQNSFEQHPHDIARGVDHVHRVADRGRDILLGHEHHQTREEDLSKVPRMLEHVIIVS